LRYLEMNRQVTNNREEVPTMTKAVAYIRASTDEQHLGPEAQRAEFTRWLQANGAESAGIFNDWISGGTAIDKRPGLRAAVAALQPADVTVLWVYDRTRFARDVALAHTITDVVRRQGARVVTSSDSLSSMPAVDNPDFMLKRGVEDLFAEHERAKIRFRTKAALAVLKSKGKVYGCVPFGFRRACTHASHGKDDPRTPDCDRLVSDDGERATLERIRSLRSEGRGFTTIATRLNKLGLRSARGGKWYASSVRSVLLTADAAA
jgi:DNA invertase Pin-like site-specific DNA recombinase